MVLFVRHNFLCTSQPFRKHYIALGFLVLRRFSHRLEVNTIYLKRNKTEIVLFEQENLLDGCYGVISLLASLLPLCCKEPLVGCLTLPSN